MTCPGIWIRAAVAALMVSDANAELASRLISTSVEALRLAILPIEYGTRVSISDESDPRAYVRLAARLRGGRAEGETRPGHADAVHHPPEPGIRARPADVRQGAAHAGGRRLADPHPRSGLLRHRYYRNRILGP